MSKRRTFDESSVSLEKSSTATYSMTLIWRVQYSDESVNFGGVGIDRLPLMSKLSFGSRLELSVKEKDLPDSPCLHNFTYADSP